MLVVKFEKSTAQRFMDCLKNNIPFEPGNVETGWTVTEIMTLIGVLFSALVITTLKERLLKKTVRRQSEAPNEEQEQDKSKINYVEYDEACRDSIINEYCCATQVLSDLAALLRNGKYDIDYKEKEVMLIKPLGQQPEIDIQSTEQKGQ